MTEETNKILEDIINSQKPSHLDTLKAEANRLAEKNRGVTAQRIEEAEQERTGRKLRVSGAVASSPINGSRMELNQLDREMHKDRDINLGHPHKPTKR